jgi:hypothetical protein
MTHPVTPPPELVQQWFDDARNAWAEPQHYVAARAAQWGAAALRAAAVYCKRDRLQLLAIADELES